jgi:hypothetical protein
MYPAGELTQLAERKALLQIRLGLRRELCVISGRRVAAAVDRIDQWRMRLQRWRGLLPLVAPFIFSPRKPRSKWGSLLKWAPLAVRAYQGWRNFAAAGSARRAAAEAEV